MTVFLASLSILFMLLLPIGLAMAWRRRVAVPWSYFCVGILTFVGSQVVHIPLNNWLTDLGLLDPTVEAGPIWVRTILLLGLTAGLCEEVARAVGYWLLARRGKGQGIGDSVMLGLGHGGIEAMVFGAVLTAASLTSLLALQGQDLDSLGLPADQLEGVRVQLAQLTATPWAIFLPAWERLVAIGLHVTLSVVVWLAFRRRNAAYVLLAILWHMAVDAGLVASLRFIDTTWQLELLFTLITIPGLVWVWRLWQKETKEGRVAAAAPMPVRSSLSLWGTAIRKELLQQWRTRRVLVISAVFFVFGLMSPLLAYATPQLLSSLEGAEQFAQLIPTPTTADAVGQYIKNITQFGFILAVLFGMGAVAGEKELGTAAMILSKPLPRWAFVLSKFVAQSLIYLLAFAIAAVGAYYTWILFEPLNLGAFLLGNGLLLIWLLTFAAATLLASVMAKSTGAAAGLALLAAVILLLGGGLPKVGPLFPGGLVAWASTLGLDGVVAAANGGALTASLMLILVSLLTAVALFENQEL
ncbi:MAG: YhfC family intramembrane metalloprotease [Chloroflexi bacterium]|nr:YhfC family intramembrane metalloprotease [Chloroflexota bacterium]